jgi:hypothetical protein
MNVTDKVQLSENHWIEFGHATWNPADLSVRDRWATRSGGFSPRSSSEIPLGSVPDIIIETAKRDLLDVPTTARIIEALVASIARR